MRRYRDTDLLRALEQDEQTEHDGEAYSE